MRNFPALTTGPKHRPPPLACKPPHAPQHPMYTIGTPSLGIPRLQHRRRVISVLARRRSKTSTNCSIRDRLVRSNTFVRACLSQLISSSFVCFRIPSLLPFVGRIFLFAPTFLLPLALFISTSPFGSTLVHTFASTHLPRCPLASCFFPLVLQPHFPWNNFIRTQSHYITHASFSTVL